MDPVRFAAHRRFFVEEVGAWAERELGVSHRREHRAVVGCSNGADLAAALGVLDAGRFGAVIALSCAMTSAHRTPPVAGAGAGAVARHWLAVGTLEPSFLAVTRDWAGALRGAGVERVLRERVAGHDYAMWEDEVAAALPWAFGR